MKKALRIGGILLAIAAVIAALIWTSADKSDGICRRVHSTTSGEFLSISDIQNYHRQQHLYPVGMSMNSISTQSIEDGMSKNDMVRSAQCFKRGDTIIDLYVEQRKPVLRVLSDGETYFVDADRKRMPVRQGMKSDVIWVRGHIGEQMAKEEIADFVVWLNDNSFWQPRIRSIEIREGKQVVLRQAEDEPLILLGRMTDYEQKLYKVRTFTEELKAQGVPIPTYKELDARFDGQIVGRK